MGNKRPRNDELILDLLKTGRIVVKEDLNDLVEVEGNQMPKTKVYVRDARSRHGNLREQTMHPNIGGHPYFSIYPNGRKGGMIWLSARRVVWYAFNPNRTSLMVCPRDTIPWNFNRWNLCLRDQNEENYLRQLNKGRPPEDNESTVYPEWEEDIPF